MCFKNFPLIGLLAFSIGAPAFAVEAPEDAPIQYTTSAFENSVIEGCEHPASSKIAVLSYPELAQKLNQEGWVFVKFEINQMQPQKIQILDSSPKGIFDDTARQVIEKGEYVAKSKNTPSCNAMLLRFGIKKDNDAFNKLYRDHPEAIKFMGKLNLTSENFKHKRREIKNGFKKKCPNISSSVLTKINEALEPITILTELSIMAETTLGVNTMREMLENTDPKKQAEIQNSHKEDFENFEKNIKKYLSESYPRKIGISLTSEQDENLRSQNANCLKNF